MYENKANKKQRAVQIAFEDVLGDLRKADADSQPATTVGEDTMSGAHLAALLEKNFEKLDPDRNGISKEELAQALLTPWIWTDDEYCMLKLLGKYFDTIIHITDDEQGPETHITHMDKDVLCQFLNYGGLTLAQLKQWRALDTTADT